MEVEEAVVVAAEEEQEEEPEVAQELEVSDAPLN